MTRTGRPTAIRAAASALAAAAALACTGSAQAFDSGPHADMTRDALVAEGFGHTPTDIAQVNAANEVAESNEGNHVRSLVDSC